jgi:Bacterial extracellular solute-binding protein, family 7
MKHRLPKYVQAWVDDRDGRAYYYLRRRGFPRVRLPGLPWSPSFMAAYEAALTGPRTAIGAGRVKPSSVSAVVAQYFDSQQFFGSKSAGTQRMRRGILERFRAAYGDRPFALLPAEWIEALLDAKPPHAARSWLATLRSLCKFAIKRGWLRADPTANIKQRAIKGDGFHTWTEDEAERVGGSCNRGSPTLPSERRSTVSAGEGAKPLWPTVHISELRGCRCRGGRRAGKRLFKLIEQTGVVPIAWGENGFREVTNSKRPIRRPEDFRVEDSRCWGTNVPGDFPGARRESSRREL